jgi:hypothetical protein
MNPGYENLSPVAGFNLLRKKTLQEIYSFGDPNEETVSLIHALFILNDDGIFQPSKNKGNPFFYLNIESIEK